MPPAELQDFRGSIRAGLAAHANSEPSLVEQLAGGSRRSAAGFGYAEHIRARLTSCGVGTASANRWLERLEAELACDPESHAERTYERLRHIIAADLPVRGPIRLQAGQPTVVAFVGPTGVGKTTTLAKLAAHFHLGESRRVGLITVDTFRVAAVEQLRSYAQIMELPLEVVAAANEIPAAIERLSDCELILVDTAGRSPRDDAGLCELRGVLAAAQPDETLLVMSCAAGEGHRDATARPLFGRARRASF